MSARRNLPRGLSEGANADEFPRSSVVDWVASSGAAELLSREIDLRLRRRRRRRLGAMVGGITGLIATVFFWQGPALDRAEPTTSAFAVATPTRQVLPDGTIADLNAQASITIGFTDAVRKVSLIRGEVHFQVAKNLQRPFVVAAGGVQFRAVGTAFALQLGEKQIELLVTEGVVAVDRPNPALSAGQSPDLVSASLAVTAGKRVVLDVAYPTANASALQVMQVDESEVNERLAWRGPRVEFTSTPLSEVVAIFHKYSDIEIILSDPAMAELELSGILRADNIDSLLKVLEEEFRLKAERRGRQIHLRR